MFRGISKNDIIACVLAITFYFIGLYIWYPLMQVNDMKVEGFVARDKDGGLWFHYVKPHRKNNIDKSWWGSNDKEFQIYDFDFPEYADLTWEEEPVKVTFILKRNK